MIKIGNVEASNIMIGEEQALKIFVGNTLVWLNYTEIEYLESSGTQWIDTGIIPNEATKAQFKVENLEPTGDVIIGYYTSSDLNDWRLFNYNQTAYYDLPVNNGRADGLRYYGGTFAKDIVYEIELGNYYVKNMVTNSNIIGRSYPESLFTGISTITLNHHETNNTNSKNRWYYVKIFDQDNLVRDYIPVRIGQVGYMYDKISKQLFANQGTGSFTLGPDIQEIEYIESSGTLWIDTGVKVEFPIRTKMKFKFSEGTGSLSATSTCILGARYKVETNDKFVWWVNHLNKLFALNYGNLDTGYLSGTDTSSIHEYETINDSIYVDGTLIYQNPSNSATSNRNYTIYLFGMNKDNGLVDLRNCNMRVYSLYIQNGNDVVFDAVPVRVGQTGYMYDKVSGLLFGNNGSGSFILGPDK